MLGLKANMTTEEELRRINWGELPKVWQSWFAMIALRFVKDAVLDCRDRRLLKIFEEFEEATIIILVMMLTRTWLMDSEIRHSLKNKFTQQLKRLTQKLQQDELQIAWWQGASTDEILVGRWNHVNNPIYGRLMSVWRSSHPDISWIGCR